MENSIEDTAFSLLKAIVPYFGDFLSILFLWTEFVCSHLSVPVWTRKSPQQPPTERKPFLFGKTPKSCGTNRAPQHSRTCSSISLKIKTEELGDNVLVR